MEEQLKRKAVELARSNEELEQFAYVASHDLQEPLRMISSFSQLLARQYNEVLDETANEYLGYMVDGASRMSALIRDLLAFSRVSSQCRAPTLTDCAEIMEEVLADLRLSMEESGAVVTHEGLPTVYADASQLVLVLRNLVSNAIKFRGEDSPVVRVSAREDGPWWRFSVEDNGIGMDPQFKRRIFIIFQRLHGIGDYPGTGIGLALCKKIVARHGGNIWVESEMGRGSTFHFTLLRTPRGLQDGGDGQGRDGSPRSSG